MGNTLPVSVEQPMQVTLILPWATPGMIWTRSKLPARITMLQPAAYACQHQRKNIRDKKTVAKVFWKEQKVL
jgi:hypothetical protein